MKTVLTYEGRSVEELSREELIAALHEAVAERDQALRAAEADRRMQQEFEAARQRSGMGLPPTATIRIVGGYSEGPWKAAR